MIRRMQLLEPEGRSGAWGVGTVGARIREGLLHDNRVVPPVLAVLALLIFAWVVAGFITEGGDDSGEGGQVSSPSSLAQRPERPKDENSKTPAPEVENRDTESVATYEPKDPFRELPGLSKGKGDGKAGEDREDSRGDGSSREERGGGRNANGDRNHDEDRGGRDVGGRGGGAGRGNDEGFIEQQNFPRDPGADEVGGPGSGVPGVDGPGNGVLEGGEGGSKGLFNSGGDLPP